MKYLVIMSLIFCSVGCFHKPNVKTGLEGKTLPSFNILLTDSISVFSTANISSDTPIVLIYFSPRCVYCRAETADIIRNIDMLNGTKICMASNFPMAEIRKYSKDYALERFSNITIGSDSSFFFMRYFRARGVPFTTVYGKDKRLKGAYMGRAYSHDIKILTDRQ